MGVIKIKSAIIHYNDNVKEDGEIKMTQTSLASLVLPDESPETQKFYMSLWANNKKVIKAHHIVRICLETGVDPNFLYDWAGIKQNEKELNDE